MYVNNESTVINDYLSSGELLVAKELVDTYIAILNTPDTLKKVTVCRGFQKRRITKCVALYIIWSVGWSNLKYCNFSFSRIYG